MHNNISLRVTNNRTPQDTKAYNSNEKDKQVTIDLTLEDEEKEIKKARTPTAIHKTRSAIKESNYSKSATKPILKNTSSMPQFTNQLS